MTVPFCVFALVSYFELKSILVSQSDTLQREKIRDSASFLVDLIDGVATQVELYGSGVPDSLPAEISDIVDIKFSWTDDSSSIERVLVSESISDSASASDVARRLQTSRGALSVDESQAPPKLLYVTKTTDGLRRVTVSLDSYLRELSKWAEYFVVSSSGIPLAASVDDVVIDWTEVLAADTKNGHVVADIGGVSWNFQLASLFLKQHYGIDNLFIVSRVSVEATLDSLTRYKWIFAGSLVLILILIGLLSAVQIHSKLRPMLHLVDAANAIANKQFNFKFDKELTGELGVLSRTMEDMSQQLSIQFQYLKLLNRIDKNTLSDVDTATVAARIVTEIRTSFPCSYVALYFVNQAEEGITILVEVDQARRKPNIKVFDNSSADVHSAFKFTSDMSDEARHQLGRLLRGKVSQNPDGLKMLPLIDEDRVYGALLLKSELNPSDSKKLDRTLSKLVSHVSVALNAKMRERSHRRQAMWDSLTGAHNRRYIESQLVSAIAEAVDRNKKGAVFFLDLDHFKKINDTLGHEFGDELLRMAYARMASRLPPDVMSARFGGDEFVLLMPEFREKSELILLAEKLVAALGQTFDVKGHPAYIGVSIGIAQFPGDGKSADELLRCADLAMYQSKRAGRGRYSLFSRTIDNRFHDRINVEKSIRHALENSEFTVHYQPQICSRSGEIVGVEALARWSNEDLGSIGPAEFIPVVEELGLIEDLGDWILKKSCHDMLWLKEQINLTLRLGVNFSAEQFSKPHFDENIRATLTACGFPINKFDVELTESVVMGNFKQITATLEKLLSQGVSISLDDFGTGYSSLSYLHKIPISSVKIDREFIDGVDSDPRKAVTARSIISMNRSLGIKTLAEGVETDGERLWLQGESCDEIQGFYYSKPLSISELKTYILHKQKINTDLTALKN